MQGKKCLHMRGKERIVPESEFALSTNYFRILSGLIWGYFTVFWEPPLLVMSTTLSFGQKKKKKKDLSFMMARYGVLIMCSHRIPQNVFSSLVIPERHMICFHFCQSTYFKISFFFVQGHHLSFT